MIENKNNCGCGMSVILSDKIVLPIDVNLQYLVDSKEIKIVAEHIGDVIIVADNIDDVKKVADSIGDLQNLDFWLKVEDAKINVSDWKNDNTYAEYPYAAEIVIDECVAEYIPQVMFDVEDANSLRFAPVSKAETGKVIIWAKTIPETEINIPVILLQ